MEKGRSSGAGGREVGGGRSSAAVTSQNEYNASTSESQLLPPFVFWHLFSLLARVSAPLSEVGAVGDSKSRQGLSQQLVAPRFSQSKAHS